MATENNENEKLLESLLHNQLELKAKLEILLDHLDSENFIDRQVVEIEALGLMQEYELLLHDPTLAEFKGIIEE